jgi:hypothetical protein
MRRKYVSSTFILSMVNCAIFKASCERLTSPLNAAQLVKSSVNVMTTTLPVASTHRNRTCPVNRLHAHWHVHSHARLHRRARLPCAFGMTPVDAFEQHRKLGGTERNAPRLGLRPHEPTTLQALGQQTHAVAIAPEDVEQIAPAPAEREDMTRVRILAENSMHSRRQRVDTAAHVGTSGSKPDSSPCAWTDHALRRSARSTLTSATHRLGL